MTRPSARSYKSVVFSQRPGFLLCAARACSVVTLLAIAASGAHADPRHWPRVLMPGVAPMSVMTRHGPRLHPAEARADRIIVQIRPGSLPRDRRAARAILEATLGVPVDRLWHDMDLCSVVVDPAIVHGELARLKSRAIVRTAEYDAVVYADYIPDTPDYRKQWHHPIILTPRAWDVLSPGSWPTVVVGDVDSGIDLNHPDLVGHVWTNPGEIAGNGIDDDANGFIDDVHGWSFIDGNNDVSPHPTGIDVDGGGPDEQVSHGTFVSGLIAASVFDNAGVAGVYPNALIMMAKVFPADGTTDIQTVVDGMNYCVDNGCGVLNLSIGSSWVQAFSAPIIKGHGKGIVVVAAAGNYGQQLSDSYWTSPVCNEGSSPLTDNDVLGVAATDPTDHKATYSSYDGSTARHFVDVSAPGGDNAANNMYSTAYYNPAWPAFTTLYTYKSGTSFSAPLVSGLAAMVKVLFPSLTNDGIRDHIKSTSDNIDRLNGIYAGKIGAGRINCARALGISLAPRAPTNVMAYDTLHDQGRSITVTWTLSGDDGGGSGTVTGYIVRRAPASSGPFTTVGSIPAGTDHCQDNTTSNGTPYYYQVGATDGTLTTYSSPPAGPATSRDDSPPPAVTTLTAVDRPGDLGGAIDLAWFGYAPPADFHEYRIYRDNWFFDTLGSRTPIAHITDPSLTQYIDTSTVDGTDYYYAVTCVDTSGNEYGAVIVAGPVHSMPNSTIVFDPGLYFMSAPVVPIDGNPSTFFGAQTPPFRYVRWDAQNSRFVAYKAGDPLNDVVRMDLGRGFWIYFFQALDVAMNGNAASSGNFTTNLAPGWQSLGNPYFATVEMQLAEIQVGTQYMDITSAESAGYISSSLYTFERATNSYRLKSALWTGDASIEPWAGFWMRVLNSCTLIIVRPSGPAGAGVAAAGVRAAVAPVHTVQHTAATPTLLWRFRLAAEGRTSGDYDNFVAASVDQVRPAAKPPAAPNAPRLYIDEAGQPCAAVARQPGRQMTWRLVLEPAPGDDRTWLAAEDLSGVPAEYAIMLTDPSAGRTVNLRQQPRIEFVGAEPRQMLLQAVRQGGAGLVVTSLAVRQTGLGAQVVVALSAPASCDVEVMNIAGRSVRLVRRGQAMTAGQNTVVWDGRSETGATVPTGLYLVRISARADTGAQVQAVRTLVLRR
jgi:hypothetical protein